MYLLYSESFFATLRKTTKQEMGHTSVTRE